VPYYQNQNGGQSKNSGGEFRKAAAALVDAATLGLGCDCNIKLHPSLREFLIDEMVDSPDRAADLFKENFIEQFLGEIIVQGQHAGRECMNKMRPLES